MNHKHTIPSLALLALLATLNPQLSAVPLGTAFTYQGRLASGANAANGVYDFSFALFDAGAGGTQQGPTLTTNGISVSDGLFQVALDFGSVFDGEARWLAISVKTNGAGTYTDLTPRQRLTPTPYASAAVNLIGPLPAGQLCGTYTNAIAFDNPGNSFWGNGSGLIGLDGGAILWGGCPPWSTCGNAGTSAGVNFLGTTDDEALELKVYRQRALRLEPTSDAPNFIAGSSDNSVTDGCFGAGIGGGANNVVSSPWASSFGAIGGGAGNRVSHQYGTVGGGGGNSAETRGATIAGGTTNRIAQCEYGSDYATIGGGSGNKTYCDWATIGGGRSNSCDSTYAYGTIGGGFLNRNVGNYGTIGGGKGNVILEGLTPDHPGATIAGGESNSVNTAYGSIGGGLKNTVQLDADYGSIGGGRQNIIETNIPNATIGGGSGNAVRYAYMQSPPGPAVNSVIGGGCSNWLYVANSVIGGGIWNTIGGYNSKSFESGHTIGGGYDNHIAYDIQNATISGGSGNSIGARESAIAGGSGNTIPYSGGHGFHAIGGGEANLIDQCLSGGHSVIGGGHHNVILRDCAVIGGGLSNQVNGIYGCVPGGDQNSASFYAFAAGHRAKAKDWGAFVWADSTDADFASTANNQFLIRAAGGVGIGTNNPQSALHVVGSARASGLLRLGSETGAAPPYYPDAGGLLIRRVASLSPTAGNVVARTDTLTLERDGSSGGLLIRWQASPGTCVVNATGVTTSGTQVAFHNAINNPSTTGTVTVFSDGQSVSHYEVSFGSAWGGTHITRAVLERHDGDYYVLGTLTSSLNQ